MISKQTHLVVLSFIVCSTFSDLKPDKALLIIMSINIQILLIIVNSIHESTGQIFQLDIKIILRYRIKLCISCKQSSEKSLQPCLKFRHYCIGLTEDHFHETPESQVVLYTFLFKKKFFFIFIIFYLFKFLLKI